MDISFGVDTQTVAIIGLMVIATVKLIDQLAVRDWAGAAKIIGAGIVGALVGFGIDGITVIIGAAVGLASSGLVTTVGFTKKTTPVTTIQESELG